MKIMKLEDFFTEDVINLEITKETVDSVLKELIKLLKLDKRTNQMLLQNLMKRENLGSTGVGKGVAIPHCRSLLVSRVRVAIGRTKKGIDYNAIDKKNANLFFLIIAPPIEVSNLYLPLLGKIAGLLKEDKILTKMKKVKTPQEFLKLLEGITL
jgi:mannitol/fructose-specific phosphotransferase system IIA component (Ntr-type)